MTLRSLATRIVAFALCTACLAGSVSAAKPGSGGGGTALPPVRYQLNFVDPPFDKAGSTYTPLAMNDVGQIVGGYAGPDGWNKAFVYDASLDPSRAIRLDLLVDYVPEGWEIRSARDINNRGMIVGILAKPGQSYTVASMPFVVFPNDVGPWHLEVLPNGPDPVAQPETHWHWMEGVSVNEQGDVLVRFTYDTDGHVAGFYTINADHFLATGGEVEPQIGSSDYYGVALNNAIGSRAPQIVGYTPSGAVFRQTLDGAAPQVFSSFSDVRGINDSGTFCGRRPLKNSYQAYSYDGVTLTTVSTLSANAINNSNDWVTYSVATIYHHGTGLIDLGKLVTGDAADLAIWNASTNKGLINLTARGAWNSDSSVSAYPAVSGCVAVSSPSGSDYLVYVLTPVAP